MQDGSQQPWLTIRVIPADTMSMTVFKLHPDMLYQFMVLSRIHVGDGLFSEIVTSRTKGTHDFYVGYIQFNLFIQTHARIHYNYATVQFIVCLKRTD